ncbi:cytidine deaminase [uncultured Acetobacteroides sp.]|uniref:cytidine deaminase n=1 Tax=uncultured Acetobacteroides sp. TaxID=1760811 RepID=UPI0029F50FF1|nr:cytidine deaminase [uncultured Acetobacteroides sp.]
MEKTFIFNYKEYASQDELASIDKELIARALDAQKKAYAPYSNFQVGAAILFEDGTIVTGSNQENAAYPSGLCAERTAMFYAQATYPEKTIAAIAITSATAHVANRKPVFPCGSCRQVLLESEQRNGKPIRVICYGADDIIEVGSAASLLPLHFIFEK